MCGIVGFIGKDAGKVVIEKLKLLQYRGYDSAGIGVSENGKIRVCKCVGSVESLKSLCDEKIFCCKCAIGHTRWATHGVVSRENAHPCRIGKVAVVHNGIFENFSNVGESILGKSSFGLDSMVFAQCFDKLLSSLSKIDCSNIAQILGKLLSKFTGSWALCILIENLPNTIFFAKNKSPLVIGRSEDEVFLSSDSGSISDVCKSVCELNDGDFGWVNDKKVQLYDKFCGVSEQNWKEISNICDNVGLNGFSCFMEKEIEEGTKCVLLTLKNSSSVIDAWIKKIDLDLPFIMCACGSAFNAGLCIKHWMRKYLSKSLDCVYASEFTTDMINEGVGIFISQSGETADTIRCVDEIKGKNVVSIGIINTFSSTLTKKCDFIIPTYAGKECAVAATKSYLTQLAAGLSFVSSLAQNDELSIEIEKLCAKLSKIDWTDVKNDVRSVANLLKGESSVYFIGRGLDYYTAKEAALKLKEVSYIHVEAIPAGELKHGSLALICKGTIVVVVLTQLSLVKKTLNNVAEIKSRGGVVVLFSPFDECKVYADFFVKVPSVCDDFSPFVMSKPMQLLACYTAIEKGLNPDYPRNLAKSVTVE